MKHTAHRQTILDTLAIQTEAISARALAHLVPDINQATVYRNLDTLEQHGLVSRFTPQGNEALYEITRPNHHHALCRECEQVIHIDAPDQKIIDLLQLDNFQVDSLEVIVKGKHMT